MHAYKVTWFDQTEDWPNTQSIEHEKYFFNYENAKIFMEKLEPQSGARLMKISIE